MKQDLQALTDHDLIEVIVQQRSEAASAELFHRYRKKVYLWSFNMTHDREEAVDLTQEIFIRIFRGLPGFDSRARFSTWVFSITRNHCLSVIGTKKEQWRKRLTLLDGHEGEDRSFLDHLHQAEVAGEVEQLLGAAAEIMKSEELEAFVLHFRDGFAVKDITNLLGCTNSSGARTLIQNAQRKFKKLIERKERCRES